MNIFGFQTQFDSAEGLRYSREVQPSGVMGINVVKVEWWRQIRDDNPNGWRVYRHHPDPRFDNYATPEESAEKAVAALGDEIGHLLVEGLITHVVDGNEDIEAEQHNLHPLRDRYGARFISRARSQLGVGTFWGNFFCGHFGHETVNRFPLSFQAMEEDNFFYPNRPSAVAFHEYDWDTLRRIFDESGDYWLCGKFSKAMAPILTQYPNAKCAITEFGADSVAGHVPGEHQGFRKTRPNLDEAIELFCGEHGLEWYYPLTEVPYLLTVLFFGCGMFSDWRGRGFDIMNGVEDTAVMERVKQFSGWMPPNGGNGMTGDIKIYNFDNGPPDGATTDLDWLVETFGDVQVRAIEDKEGLTLQEGDVVYKLDYLDARLGDANIVINVRDEDGNPVQGETVMFGWPDAPAHGYADKPSNWTGSGVPGDTNENGDVGPGLGTGAYYSPAHGEKGPHFVWVYGLPSDYVDGLGMIAGTNHAHLNLGYRAVVVGEVSNGDGEGKFQLVDDPCWSGGEPNVIVIELVEGQSRNFHETRADVFVTDEAGEEIYWESPNPIMPVALTRYECGATYDPEPGEEVRFFFIGIRDWLDADKEIIGWIGPFRYTTGEGGMWTAQVEWTEEELEEPEGELEERVEALEQGLVGLRAEVAAALRAAADRL